LNPNPPPGVPAKGSHTSSYKEPEGKDEDEDTSGNESEQSTTARATTSKPDTSKPATEKSIATAKRDEVLSAAPDLEDSPFNSTLLEPRSLEKRISFGPGGLPPIHPLDNIGRFNRINQILADHNTVNFAADMNGPNSILLSTNAVHQRGKCLGFRLL